MSIQHPPEHLIVVELPFRELDITDELKRVNETISHNPDCDVIIDFSKVEVVTSSSISNLLILRGMLTEQGRRLVLCKVAVITKCVFKVAGLDEVFEFAKDKPTAVAAAQNASYNVKSST